MSYSAAMKQATRSWERPRGSRVTVRPLVPEPEPEELSLDGDYDEPQAAYRPPPRAPGSRPGDKLRRIAAYSAAASAGISQKAAAPAPRTASTPWSLKELLDALAQEYEMAA